MTCNNTVTGASFNQTLWIAAQSATPATPSGPPVPAVDPHALALQAERSLQLPAPVLGLDPSGTSVVNLATWLWIDPSLWHAYSVTASAGPVSATAVATPVSVHWTTGDGGVETCNGPGVPYDTEEPASGQTTSCDHVYLVTSAGRSSPDGDPDDAAFTVVATVSWSVQWSAEGAPGGGPLPSLSTSSSVPLRVEQIESLFTGGPPAGGAVAEGLSG